MYELLQTCDRFKEKASKNQGKDLVILTSHKRAISMHFPYHKMTDIGTETLVIRYISAGRNQTTTTSSKDKKEYRGEMAIFDVKTTGDTNILTMVMNNLGLRKLADEVTVYGYKGQTVREVLEQDGRFSDEVLQSNYYLQDTKNGIRTEMSTHANYIDGRCFKITRGYRLKTL